jgi:drug/metabolite transporter (DMT)-like permease
MPSSQEKAGIVHALSAAFLFGISIPIAKHLLGAVPAQWLAGLLYLGSGLGLAVRTWIAPKQIEAPLKKSHLVPLAAAIVFGGVLAPVLLLQGLQRTPASSASLLLNFEAVFTAVIAWAVFRENMGARVALGMMSIVAGAVVLSWKGPAAMSGLYGPGAIIAACFCWALDNNFTQKISGADPVRIAMVKGLAAGTVNAAIALTLRQPIPPLRPVAGALVLGFASYGFSLVLYVRALRALGTARAGNYFSTAPFIGAALSVILWREEFTLQLAASGVLMAGGLWLHFTERHQHWHVHEAMEHEHLHVHDEHHRHEHQPDDPRGEPHSHPHRHDRQEHTHPHYPDIHHRHKH